MPLSWHGRKATRPLLVGIVPGNGRDRVTDGLSSLHLGWATAVLDGNSEHGLFGLGASQVLKQSDCADTLSFAADCSHRLERSSQNILLLRSSDFCAFERQSSARLRNSLAFELGMAGPHYC
jgi:hypothetical protein